MLPHGAHTIGCIVASNSKANHFCIIGAPGVAVVSLTIYRPMNGTLFMSRYFNLIVYQTRSAFGGLQILARLRRWRPTVQIARMYRRVETKEATRAVRSNGRQVGKLPMRPFVRQKYDRGRFFAVAVAGSEPRPLPRPPSPPQPKPNQDHCHHRDSRFSSPGFRMFAAY
jgi:hypothetical protein